MGYTPVVPFIGHYFPNLTVAVLIWLFLTGGTAVFGFRLSREAGRRKRLARVLTWNSPETMFAVGQYRQHLSILITGSIGVVIGIYSAHFPPITRNADPGSTEILLGILAMSLSSMLGAFLSDRAYRRAIDLYDANAHKAILPPGSTVTTSTPVIATITGSTGVDRAAHSSTTITTTPDKDEDGRDHQPEERR